MVITTPTMAMGFKRFDGLYGNSDYRNFDRLDFRDFDALYANSDYKNFDALGFRNVDGDTKQPMPLGTKVVIGVAALAVILTVVAVVTRR